MMLFKNKYISLGLIILIIAIELRRMSNLNGPIIAAVFGISFGILIFGLFKQRKKLWFISFIKKYNKLLVFFF